MEKKETYGAALAPLFRLSRDAVCGISHGSVVFTNPAACRLFGMDITGEPAEDRFSGLEEDSWGECFATSIVIGDVPRSVTAAHYEDILVVTIQHEDEALPPVPPAALRQMRSATLNLRLSLDKLTNGKPENEETYASILFHSYYSLLHLTNQLSDVNALSSGALTCRMQPLSVNRLIDELMDSVQFFLHEKHISIRCELPPEELFMLGDREKLEQLLLILLSNSLLRTGVNGTISVRLKKHGRQCRLSIYDDGCGISESELAGAFVPRREDTLTDTTDTGLGLSVAQGLAQLHGGLLVIEKTSDGATSAHLQFPVTGMLSLRDAVPRDAGPEQILTELCSVLPLEAYARKYRE